MLSIREREIQVNNAPLGRTYHQSRDNLLATHDLDLG